MPGPFALLHGDLISGALLVLPHRLPADLRIQLEPGRVALWLYCDDVDAEVAALREHKVEVTREPEDMEWGERMAIVLDPDGNEILLGRPAA